MPRPRTGAQGLQDYLPKKDLTADTWAYNNTLDRFRMELPPSGDPGASGVVQLNLDNWEGFLPVTASGTTGIETGRFQETVTITSANPTQVKAGASGKYIYVTSIMISASAASNIALEDDAGTEIIKPVYLAANGGFVMTFDPIAPLVVPLHKALMGDSSTSDAYSVTIVGYDAPQR